MLTLPVEAGTAVANPPARILVIGRSETVLSEAVRILREKGYAAGATNEFDRTLDLWAESGVPLDVAQQLDTIVREDAAAVEGYFARSFRDVPALFVFSSQPSFALAPHGYAAVVPARAAYSHSASLGRR